MASDEIQKYSTPGTQIQSSYFFHAAKGQGEAP